MSEKAIHKRIRRSGDWGQLDADVQIVVSSNIGRGHVDSAEQDAPLEASDPGPKQGHQTPEREEESDG
jgi:hypothetical protein